MNNYQLKYSKTQVFNTRFAVKDMMGSGGGGGSAQTLKSSDNSIILNADQNGEIDIRRNNYICREEVTTEYGEGVALLSFSAIFRPTQEQDVPQNRRAQTFVLTNKNGFYARVTIMAKDIITDPSKDITIFAEGDTTSRYDMVNAWCFSPLEETDAFVVMVGISGYLNNEGALDENERLYVSADGDNTFVDFVHDYDYVVQHSSELSNVSELLQGDMRDVLPSFAYVEALEQLNVGGTVTYISSPKIVPFHVALYDAFHGHSLIKHEEVADSYQVESNARIDSIPIFDLVKSSQDAYDFYTQSYVDVKNYTKLTDEQLFNALQPSQHPYTFVVSTFIYDGRYHCTFYDYSTPVQ